MADMCKSSQKSPFENAEIVDIKWHTGIPGIHSGWTGTLKWFLAGWKGTGGEGGGGEGERV